MFVMLLSACSSQNSHKSFESVIELEDVKFEVSNYELKSSNNPNDKDDQTFHKNALYYQFTLLNTGVEKIGSEKIDGEKVEVYIEAHDHLFAFMEPNLFENNNSNMWRGRGSQQAYINPNDKGVYFFTYIIADNQDLDKVIENARKADIVVLLVTASGESREIKRFSLAKD